MLINPEMHSVRLISQTYVQLLTAKNLLFSATRDIYWKKEKEKRNKKQTNNMLLLRTVADTSALDLILHIGKDNFKSDHLLVTFGITMDSRYEKKVI